MFNKKWFSLTIGKEEEDNTSLIKYKPQLASIKEEHVKTNNEPSCYNISPPKSLENSTEKNTKRTVYRSFLRKSSMTRM